jgi:hypothetical protein
LQIYKKTPDEEGVDNIAKTYFCQAKVKMGIGRGYF